MNTQNNKRYQNTDEAIIREVYRIMWEEKRPISRITVREICEGTGINRSTFYAHYQDVFDVGESVEKHMSEMAGESFMASLHESGSMQAGFEGLFAFIREYRDFYLLYLGESHRLRAIEMLIEPHQERLRNIDPADLGCRVEGELQYRQDFFSAGIAAMLYRWLKNGCRETPRQLCEMLARQYNQNAPF